MKRSSKLVSRKRVSSLSKSTKRSLKKRSGGGKRKAKRSVRKMRRNRKNKNMCGCENKQKGGGISKDDMEKILKKGQLSEIDLHQIIGTVDGMDDDEKIACSEQFDSMMEKYGEEGHSRECADHESIVCGMFGCHTDDTKCKLVKMCERTLLNQRRAGNKLAMKKNNRNLKLKQKYLDLRATQAGQKEKFTLFK